MCCDWMRGVKRPHCSLWLARTCIRKWGRRVPWVCSPASFPLASIQWMNSSGSVMLPLRDEKKTENMDYDGFWSKSGQFKVSVLFCKIVVNNGSRIFEPVLCERRMNMNAQIRVINRATGVLKASKLRPLNRQTHKLLRQSRPCEDKDKHFTETRCLESCHGCFRRNRWRCWRVNVVILCSLRGFGF